MSFWLRDVRVPEKGWKVMHDGLPALSALEDFRAAKFDLERKLKPLSLSVDHLVNLNYCSHS